MPHQSQGLRNDTTVASVTVLSVVPAEELSVRRDFVASKTNVPLLGLVCVPCVGVAVAGGEANQKREQTQEDIALLPALRDNLPPKFSRSTWEESLRKSAARATEIGISALEIVDRSSSPSQVESAAKGQAKQPLLFLELDHYLSQDLDKVRMQLRARLFDASGKTAFDTYYFFLPPAVSGATKAAAINVWSINAAEQYRRTVELGVLGMLDALQITLLSRQSHTVTTPEDASSVLARRSCYAGDFEVGIPMKAYESGEILATRDSYWIVSLANHDVLIIPACDR